MPFLGSGRLATAVTTMTDLTVRLFFIPALTKAREKPRARVIVGGVSYCGETMCAALCRVLLT